MVAHDAVYGDRSQRHHAILMLGPDELHAQFPLTQALAFNQTMTKKSGYSESAAKKIPGSVLNATKQNGRPHLWVIGNQLGELLPKFLMTKWVTIESGVAFGAAHGVGACPDSDLTSAESTSPRTAPLTVCF